MTRKTLKFTRTRDVKQPQRGTARSAGIDFFVPNDSQVITLLPHSDVLIPSGIKVNIPEGYMLIAENKSGVVTSRSACERIGRNPKKDAYECSPIIGACVVDEDYQGEVHIHLINTGSSAITIQPGTKIAQFVLVPVEYCSVEEVPSDELYTSNTERGTGGFGSTNVHD